jgi:hypothetical protein
MTDVRPTKTRSVHHQGGRMRAAGATVVGFERCCELIGVSRRTGERMLAAGFFPIPELPRVTRTHRFSMANISSYLDTAAIDDARIRPKRRRYVGMG